MSYKPTPPNNPPKTPYPQPPEKPPESPMPQTRTSQFGEPDKPSDKAPLPLPPLSDPQPTQAAIDAAKKKPKVQLTPAQLEYKRVYPNTVYPVEKEQ